MQGVRRISELASCTSAPTTSDGVTGAAAAEYESILGFLPGTSIGTTNISQAATGLLTIGRIRVERRREQWLPDDLYRHKSSKEEKVNRVRQYEGDQGMIGLRLPPKFTRRILSLLVYSFLV